MPEVKQTIAESRADIPGYSEYLRETASDPKGHERQRVVWFRARWQLAKDFAGLKLHSSHDPRTIRGYEPLLGVTWAYSAIDQFFSATGKGVWEVHDGNLAEELRG